ncbi:hypothetical protein [Streptomyces luteocolor]|nr:hypothetical protein [Streptomyces luteocolor]
MLSALYMADLRVHRAQAIRLLAVLAKDTELSGNHRRMAFDELARLLKK